MSRGLDERAVVWALGSVNSTFPRGPGDRVWEGGPRRVALGRCESDEGGEVRGSRRRFSLVLGSECPGAGALFVVQTMQRELYIPSRRITGQEVREAPRPTSRAMEGRLGDSEQRVGGRGLPSGTPAAPFHPRACRSHSR